MSNETLDKPTFEACCSCIVDKEGKVRCLSDVCRFCFYGACPKCYVEKEMNGEEPYCSCNKLK